MIYNKRNDSLVIKINDVSYEISNEYDNAIYTGCGLIRVFKGGKWGLINLMGETVCEAKYDLIRMFDGPYAIVGILNEEVPISKYVKASLSSEKIDNSSRICFRGEDTLGLIDTRGNEILSLKYSLIEKWKNGYYYVREKDTRDKILLSSHLGVVVRVKSELSLSYFNDEYFIVEESGFPPKKGLYDYSGKVIIPEKTFADIRMSEFGYFIIIFIPKCEKEYGVFNGSVGFADQFGNIIYKTEGIEINESPMSGLFWVKRLEPFGCGTFYNCININGVELFEWEYNEIKLLSNSLFAVRKDKHWGCIDINRNIITNLLYTKIKDFDGIYSEIYLDDDTVANRIDKHGVVYVKKEEKYLPIPTSYYWGTEYVNGFCVVRDKNTRRLGLIDEEGKEVLLPAFSKIVVYNNGRIIGKMKPNSIGFYDYTGRCILPPMCSYIEFINPEKLRVGWNLKHMTSWKNGKCIPGNRQLASVESGYLYDINKRSALCNLEGKILQENQFILVGKFEKNYASSASRFEIIDNSAKVRGIGVIDIDGNTVISPEYDNIVVQDNNYAKVWKGKTFGIANLITGKVTMFDDVEVKHTWCISNSGCVSYSNDAVYDRREDFWKGRTYGLLCENGNHIEPGIYGATNPLGNGLVRVTDPKSKLHGILDKNGKELLPAIYKEISTFRNGTALICLGGEADKLNKTKIVGGKWGIIDENCNFVVDCSCEKEQLLPKVDFPFELKIIIKEPRIILSEMIKSTPIVQYRSSDESYDDDMYDVSNSRFGGYNGYSDDDIYEAFDGDPSMTWNVD